MDNLLPKFIAGHVKVCRYCVNAISSPKKEQCETVIMSLSMRHQAAGTSYGVTSFLTSLFLEGKFKGVHIILYSTGRTLTR